MLFLLMENLRQVMVLSSIRIIQKISDNFLCSKTLKLLPMLNIQV